VHCDIPSRSAIWVVHVLEEIEGEHGSLNSGKATTAYKGAPQIA